MTTESFNQILSQLLSLFTLIFNKLFAVAAVGSITLGGIFSAIVILLIVFGFIKDHINKGGSNENN